ncbi:MAG: gliding motility protein GldL [Paludibacteraceae bacterium]|nr:gliding motility protein GldL [Paludibacteraceae bacterium]
MSQNQSKFDLWWNAPKTKRIVGAAYSVGAAVVIIGALFKIMHWDGASEMLTVGMSVEAVLFALGIFDKPHQEYHWEKVFDFEADGTMSIAGGVAAPVGQPEKSSPSQTIKAPQLDYSEAINEEDVKKLSEGIKNLSATAQQLAGLATVAGSTDGLVKNIEAASAATGKFVVSQDSLNSAAGQLNVSYQGITDGMQAVEANTKAYAGRIDDINKNLSSINSIYEIQLKNIQAQSEGLTRQTETVNAVTRDLSAVNTEVEKMKLAAVTASQQTETFKQGTEKLAKQVADLNQVYGNMLNALN